MNIKVRLRYALAKLEEYQKAEAYRFYCTTALKCIADNTRMICGGSAPEKSFWDILHGASNPAKKMTQEEIIDSVTKKGGLKVIDETE